MTDLQKPLEDPIKDKDPFFGRLRKTLGIERSNAALIVILFFLIVSFALYVYLDPRGQALEVVEEKSSDRRQTSQMEKEDTYKVREETISTIVRASGVVRATRATKVRSPISGKLADVPTALGSKVTSVSIIATIDTTTLKKKVARAQAQHDLSQATLEQLNNSSEARPEDVKIAQLNADIAAADLDAARADLGAATIKAPGAGVLDSLNVTTGQVVSAGQVIGEIVDPQNYVLEVLVAQADAFSIHVDSTATITFASRAQDSYVGEVTSIGFATGSSRSAANEVPIQLLFEPEQKLDWLRIGLHGAQVEIPAIKRVIPVPRASVISTGDQHVVFVRSNGDFSPRRIKVGLFDDEMCEVVEGLVKGEVIAVK